MDIMKSGEEFLLGGFEQPHSHLLPVLYMIKMDFGFQVLNVINLTSQPGIKSIQRLKRFELNDNFAVACDQSLIIYDIAERRAWKLTDTMSEDIFDFCMCKDTIVLKGDGTGPFKMVKIDESIRTIYDVPVTVAVVESPPVVKQDVIQTQNQTLILPASSNLASPQASFSQPKEATEVRKGPEILTKSEFSVSQTNPRSLTTSKTSTRPQPPVVYTSNKYENYSLYRIPVSGSGGLEKITANKKFNKIFACSNKQVHMIEQPANSSSLLGVFAEGDVGCLKTNLNLSRFDLTKISVLLG